MNYNAAVELDVAELLSTTRTRADPTFQPQKKRRVVGGQQPFVPVYRYATLSTELRSTYEALRDWARSEPLIAPRKHCRPGMFNSFRLRALQRFCWTVGGGDGLTIAEQEQLFDLIDIWEGTKPGMPIDAGHERKLRDIFKSANTFKNALRDDLDAAVIDEGWRQCTMLQNGDTVTEFFRPVLDVVLDLIRESKHLMLWSGGDRPAPPTAMRESPMDGDAFRSTEEEVVREHGPAAFVLGIHTFSDATHVSKSGGKWTGGACDWAMWGLLS